MSELLDALKLALELLKNHELDRARDEIQRTLDSHTQIDVEMRSRSVLEINRAIQGAKMELTKIREELEEIPGLDPVEREHILVAPVVKHFEDVISRLRAKKNTLARP